MARELPIFPLPIILFPGAPQPLHIFEPRYRQLLADCLAADRRFGVAYVAPPRAPDDDPAPRPGDLGCVALIRSTQELPDGRSNVLTVGERRFVLIAWCAGDQPYRLGRVEEFDDEPSEPGEAEALAAGVRDDFSRLVGALGVLTDREHEAIGLPADPQELSFQVSAALELDAEAKRPLQALRSTTARLRHPGELIAVVRLLAAHHVPFVPRGAGTGLSGGALADERAVLVVLTRLARILRIDPVNRVAVVEPGVVNARLSAAAAPHGLRYTPDPSSQTACTLGGNVA